MGKSIQTTREFHGRVVNIDTSEIVEEIFKKITKDNFTKFDTAMIEIIVELCFNAHIRADTFRNFEDVLKEEIELIIEKLDFNERNSL